MSLEQPLRMGFAVPALRAAFWSAIQGWGGRLLSTAVFLLLARLLDPAAFGLVALALALITFAQAVVGFGLPDALAMSIWRTRMCRARSGA